MLSFELVCILVFFLCVILVIVNLIFGSVFDGIIDLDNDILNTTSITSFVAVCSGLSGLLAKFTVMDYKMILLIAGIVSLIVTTILNILVFIPLNKLGDSSSYNNEDLIGRDGEVTLSIPRDGGLGEVMIDDDIVVISKTAKSINNSEIKKGVRVTVEEVRDNVVYVSQYMDLSKESELN